MADDIPPGFKLDDDLPPGFTLDPLPAPRPGDTGAPAVPISGREGPARPWEAGAPRVPFSGVEGDGGSTFPTRENRVPMAPGTALAGTILDNASLGITRQPTAALRATIDGLRGDQPGTTWSQRFDNTLQALQDRYTEAGNTVGPLAPALAAVSSLPANYILGGGGTAAGIPRMMMQSIPPAYIEGVSKSVKGGTDAFVNGVTNALTSMGLTGAAGVAGKALPGSRAVAADEARAAQGIPGRQIEAQGSNLYHIMENGGVGWGLRQSQGLQGELLNMRNSGRFNPSPNSPLTPHFEHLLDVTQGPVTFATLQGALRDIGKIERGQNTDEYTRGVATALKGHINNFIQNNVPNVNPNNLDIERMWPEAARLVAQGKLVEETAAPFRYANERARIPGSGSGELSQRSAAQTILEDTDPRVGNRNPYQPNDRDLLAQIRDGTAVQNRAGDAGRLLTHKIAPVASGVIGALGPAAFGYSRGGDTLGTATSMALFGGGAAAGTDFAGRMLKRYASNIGQENVNQLLRSLSTGSPEKMPYNLGQGLGRDQLAQFIRERDMLRLIGQTPSGE